MEFKDFQQRVLDVFDAFLDELAKQQIRADGIAKLAIEQPELNLLVPDSAADAWGVLHAKGRLPSARAALG